MRRLASNYFSYIFEFNEGVINSLVIENRQLFRQFVSGIYSQIEGNEGEITLSVNYTPKEMRKEAELFLSFFPFEINKKSLLNKIIATIEKKAVDEEWFSQTNKLLADIEKFALDITFDYSCDFDFNGLSIASLIKALGITIAESYQSELEKIIDYMQLIREYDRDKLFIFVNLRSYYSDEDIEKFYKTLILKKFDVLFIDNKEYKRIEGERLVIIDEDLCEIY